MDMCIYTSSIIIPIPEWQSANMAILAVPPTCPSVRALIESTGALGSGRYAPFSSGRQELLPRRQCFGSPAAVAENSTLPTTLLANVGDNDTSPTPRCAFAVHARVPSDALHTQICIAHLRGTLYALTRLSVDLAQSTLRR